MPRHQFIRFAPVFPRDVEEEERADDCDENPDECRINYPAERGERRFLTSLLHGQSRVNSPFFVSLLWRPVWESMQDWIGYPVKATCVAWRF